MRQQHDCYSLSSYNQWIQYLSSYESDPSPSSTPSPNPFKSIQQDYGQFLQGHPFSIHSWIKYIQLAQKYEQLELIPEIYEQATQSVPYSAYLWYCRLSSLLTQNPTAPNSLELVQIALDASQYLTGHPDAAEAWRLIFYLLQLHGTHLQSLYCYWRALSQPSPYFSLLCDLFQQFKAQTPLQISSSSSCSSDTELSFISLLLSSIERSVEMRESRAQDYLLHCFHYEKDLVQKYFEDERRLSQFELNIWHQYLSAEELLCEAPSTDSLPLSSLPITSLALTPTTPTSTLPSTSIVTQSTAPELECLTREKDCLRLCHPKQITNASILERLEERRRYDRVIQLYERCLLVCPSHSGLSASLSVALTLSHSLLYLLTRYLQRSGGDTSPGPCASHNGRIEQQHPIVISKGPFVSAIER
jgi:hypothetical protein